MGFDRGELYPILAVWENGGEIAIRDAGTDPFEVSEIERQKYDKVIERRRGGAV